MAKNGKVDRDFFILPHPALGALVLFALYQMFCATFAPLSFPGFLGPLTTLVTYFGLNHPSLCKVITVFAILSHLFEARVARKICRKLNLSDTATTKWTLSTFVFGYPSLGRLKAAMSKNKK